MLRPPKLAFLLLQRAASLLCALVVFGGYSAFGNDYQDSIFQRPNARISITPLDGGERHLLKFTDIDTGEESLFQGHYHRQEEFFAIDTSSEAIIMPVRDRSSAFVLKQGPWTLFIANSHANNAISGFSVLLQNRETGAFFKKNLLPASNPIHIDDHVRAAWPTLDSDKLELNQLPPVYCYSARRGQFEATFFSPPPSTVPSEGKWLTLIRPDQSFIGPFGNLESQKSFPQRFRLRYYPSGRAELVLLHPSDPSRAFVVSDSSSFPSESSHARESSESNTGLYVGFESIRKRLKDRGFDPDLSGYRSEALQSAIEIFESTQNIKTKTEEIGNWTFAWLDAIQNLERDGNTLHLPVLVEGRLGSLQDVYTLTTSINKLHSMYHSVSSPQEVKLHVLHSGIGDRFIKDYAVSEWLAIEGQNAFNLPISTKHKTFSPSFFLEPENLAQEIYAQTGAKVSTQFAERARSYLFRVSPQRLSTQINFNELYPEQLPDTEVSPPEMISGHQDHFNTLKSAIQSLYAQTPDTLSLEDEAHVWRRIERFEMRLHSDELFDSNFYTRLQTLQSNTPENWSHDQRRFARLFSRRLEAFSKFGIRRNPIFFQIQMGAPGAGKSEIVRNITEHLEGGLVEVNMAQTPSNIESLKTFIKSRIVESFSEYLMTHNRLPILHLDELDKCPEVIPLLLELIESPQLRSEYRVLRGAIIIASLNTLETTPEFESLMEHPERDTDLEKLLIRSLIADERIPETAASAFANRVRGGLSFLRGFSSSEHTDLAETLIQEVADQYQIQLIPSLALKQELDKIIQELGRVSYRRIREEIFWRIERAISEMRAHHELAPESRWVLDLNQGNIWSLRSSHEISSQVELLRHDWNQSSKFLLRALRNIQQGFARSAERDPVWTPFAERYQSFIQSIQALQPELTGDQDLVTQYIEWDLHSISIEKIRFIEHEVHLPLLNALKTQDIASIESNIISLLSLLEELDLDPITEGSKHLRVLLWNASLPSAHPGSSSHTLPDDVNIPDTCREAFLERRALREKLQNRGDS